MAGLRAAAADLGAVLHCGLGGAESFAVVGAGGAEGGAEPAEIGGVVGLTGHEADGGGAECGAVVHQALMVGRGVRAAEGEAVVSGVGADGGARGTIVEALLKVGGLHRATMGGGARDGREGVMKARS